MKILRAFFLFAAAFCSFEFPARAEGYLDHYVGPWRQIASNAGACSSCKVVIDREGGQAQIKASNGWDANLRLALNGDSAPVLEGPGRWDTRPPHWATETKALSIRLQVHDGRLFMTMTLADTSGSPRVIKAVYRRDWLGS